jgi:hypothetical protein
MIVRLLCRDRTSTAVRVRISDDRTVGELKAEIGKMIGRSPEELVLRMGGRELVDLAELDTYEVRNGECIELEYK